MENILNDPKYQELLSSYAGKYGEDLEKVKQESNSYLEELYTYQQPMLLGIATQISEYILQRGYDRTIDTDPEEIKTLAKIMRQHPVAFVMTHKTYIDMMVLGVALARHGLPIPYIFSGINMSFFGVGEIGRKSGVIFIRRSFKDNHLYKLVLRFFISKLVDEKENFMWAIEGTRSRTGKIVWPKMGILKYIVEADKESVNDVKYIPVSIVYDMIPDVEQMVKEGRGSKKSQESFMWFVDYIRKMGDDFGKISIRFSDPIDIAQPSKNGIQLPSPTASPELPEFAFNLVHHINRVTPVTTGSLICMSLLSQFALNKKELEAAVAELMQIVECHKNDALVERGKSLGQSVQDAINRFIKMRLVKKIGNGVKAKYALVPENYLNAKYYANMSVHYLYHMAFIELALTKLKRSTAENRLKVFWQEIMKLRDQFKFEYFYSNRLDFTDEIEENLNYLNPNWFKVLKSKTTSPLSLIKGRRVLFSQTVLSTYIEAYKIVAECLFHMDRSSSLKEEDILNECLFLGEEMHWLGKIHRLDSVSKPFIINGLRLAQNKGLYSKSAGVNKREVKKWISYLDDLTRRMNSLKSFRDTTRIKKLKQLEVERFIVPGSKTETVTSPVLEGERGPHIGAFFDLDRTLIKGFSAKEFFQNRLFSGKMTRKEITAQFSGMMVYAMGNRNFAGLAAIGAQGVKGVSEEMFLEVGEEVYLKHLAHEIYPESRALVDAHLAMGHTVAIISAATPYQVNPIARDLGIDHIMCTRMEVKNGKFTGMIIEPACWGEGKAIAAKNLAEEFKLDLSKSHFYTDSAEDLPLLEIVGHPHPINPDEELSKISFDNNWDIVRFNDDSRPGISNVIRTGLTVSSLFPAVLTGLMTGTMNMSFRDGINSMMAAIGDIGTALAGIRLVIKGKENLWNNRPAVFIFNHQSNVDLLIMCKLIRKDSVALAKKELKYTPIGPVLQAAGVIFLDRGNREKAINAMQPAVEALKNGTSVGIAPEGTRSKDYNLGKFKKGAFHLAMQAKVPIVPIIIKNAHDVMPKGSNLIKPSIVEVVVLPAIKTTRWKKETLDKNIKSIRDKYLHELHQDYL
ncbi:MAG: HAD-IB family hydrolase [Saprospiraceae bacterium]|nr:HAD-IB family hydrolase [Saprospiraceae bacterium]